MARYRDRTSTLIHTRAGDPALNGLRATLAQQAAPNPVPESRRRPMSTLAARWRRGQRGWPASFPVAQLPNPPLLVATAGWLVDAAADGSGYARAVFFAGLAAWAWQELTDGVNWLRRVLGAAGLVYVVVNVGAALAAQAG